MKKYDDCMVMSGEYAGEKAIIIDDDYEVERPYRVLFTNPRMKDVNRQGGKAYKFEELEVM